MKNPNLHVVKAGVMDENRLSDLLKGEEVYEEQLMPEKKLDWTFFSPAGNLTPGQRTGKYRLGKDHLVVNEKGESRISVEDYAAAMMDELDKPKHHRERFTIGY